MKVFAFRILCFIMLFSAPIFSISLTVLGRSKVYCFRLSEHAPVFTLD